MKNNVWYLTKQRFSTILFHKGRIITFGVLTAVFIALNLISLMFLNGNSAQLLSNILIICASAVVAVLMIALSLSIFRGEVTSNQVSLELRQGYKQRQIYLARVIEIVFDITVFMIIALAVNLITIAAKDKLDDVIWYHMFVTSLGWYVLIAIVSVGMGVFFCTFLGSAWSGTISTIILLIVIVLGGVINGIVQIYNHNGRAKDDYSANLISKKIDSEAINFAMNDLGIYSKQQWKDEVEDRFVKVLVQDNGGIDKNGYVHNNSDDSKNKDLGKIDGSLYNGQFKDYQIYYNMISGDWRSIKSESGSNSDNKININRYGLSYDFDNIFASFAALGNRILEDELDVNSPIGKFFDASEKFFKQNKFSNIKFNDILNWSMLDGKPGKKESWYSNSDGWTYVDARRSDQTISHENFYGIMKAASKSKLGDSYAFLKDIANLSDDTVLSSMYNTNDQIWDSGLDFDNVELNDRLYPTYAVGENGLEETNMQDVIKRLGITPAELIFNKNIMYFVSKAFDDMDRKANKIDGQTIISVNGYSETLVTYDGTVYMKVENSKSSNDDMGYHQRNTLDSTGLEYGKLGDKYDNALTIDQVKREYNSETGKYELKETKADITDLEYKHLVETEVNSMNQNSDTLYGDYIVGKADIDDFDHNYGYQYRYFTISNNSAFDIDNSDEYDDDYANIDLNPWKKVEAAKTVISAIKYDANDGIIDFKEWNDSDNAVENIQNAIFVKDNNGKNISLDGLNTDKDDNGYSSFIGKNLNIKINFGNEANVNTKLIDGTLFVPDFDYEESQTHKSAISWIYNPVTQLGSMFNGVNYSNALLDNLMTSYLTANIVGINNLNVEVIEKTTPGFINYNSISFKRSSKVEAVYVYYTILESLIVFAGYWIYRKKIVS